MGYRIVEPTPDAGADDVSRRAAELAGELHTLIAPFGAMLYLAEFALACVVSKRADRPSFEEHVGEAVPDSLWRELEAMSRETAGLSELAGSETMDRRDALAVLALGCVSAGEGSRQLLTQRLGTPVTESEWLELQQEVARKLPKLKKTWRQMRDQGMVIIPESLADGRTE
jgi:hypothetical protein